MTAKKKPLTDEERAKLDGNGGVCPSTIGVDLTQFNPRPKPAREKS